MSKNHPYTNKLAEETSPYLLQHAHNPVDWHAWNETTLQAALTTQKLMIVSIGYAACHWCHVMEHESFEDTEVAAVMNKDFISVKVDREERPDIDQIYINAVQLMTGRGGWPLNVVTLPGGRPIWGGTYFQKEEWINALQQIQQMYLEEPEKLEAYATRLKEGINQMDLVHLNTTTKDLSTFSTKDTMTQWKKSFDPRFGGYNRAPKFMMPSNFQYLLQHAVQCNDQPLLEHVNLTLQQMAYGGLYDQIGGGFSRYSVDEKWHVPHFEKMLYDNAQLVSLYSEAYKVTKDPLYKEVVTETLQFIARELTQEEGAFYSSLDADSLNEKGILEEGAYYSYTKEELQTVLEEDFDLFKEYYNINSFGKWEHNTYVLIRDKSDAEIAQQFELSPETLQQKKKNWKQLLYSYREKRERPRLDDKTLTSWNGLMLKGYVDAYKAFQIEAYKEVALKNAYFIAEKQIQENGALYHNYKNGKSTINGYLEDYATVIEAYISLYEITLDEQWLQYAKKLTDYTFTYFFDEEKKMFYFTSSEDPKLVTRIFEYRDNVIPASNSIMAKNLFVLSHHFAEKRYKETSVQMLKNILPQVEEYPSGYSNWLSLLAHHQAPFYEVVVVGPDALEKTKELQENYLPNILIAGSTSSNESYLTKGRFVEGSTYVYVCENNTCRLPVTATEKALQIINP